MIAKSYQIQQVLIYAGYPKYKNHSRIYECGCPICHEGTSWGKKSRLYFYEEVLRLQCYNCGWRGSAIDFIIKQTGKTYTEILLDSHEYNTIDDISSPTKKYICSPVKESSALPQDSINLIDPQQVKYYSSNSIVQAAIQYIKSRKIDSAVNTPKTIWLSLIDFTHKNRLILPFYDNSKIIYYQSRSILPSDTRPKYLSKANSVKSLFNFDNIDITIPYIFVCEGPINSMFLQNAIATAGITESKHKHFNDYQQQQLSRLPQHKLIWVLDSQWVDVTSYKKTIHLLNENQNVFLWPKDIGLKCKDINDWALYENKNEIHYENIIRNVFTGRDGLKRMLTYPKIVK